MEELVLILLTGFNALVFRVIMELIVAQVGFLELFITTKVYNEAKNETLFDYIRVDYDVSKLC